MTELEIYLIFALVITLAAYAYETSNAVDCRLCMNGPAEISAGINTAHFLPGVFEWNQSYMADLEYNQSLHIPANATENWTIWKGDAIVAYIPRTS